MRDKDKCKECGIYFILHSKMSHDFVEDLVEVVDDHYGYA